VTALSLNIDNGMAPLYVVGSDETLEPSQQRSRLTGSMTVYFENTTVLDKFINETETSLQFSLELDGNQYMFYLPRVKYNSGQPDVTSEDPVTLSVDFVGLLDPVTSNNIVLERIPA
ncbi:MAG: phage tail tube protein, partial [Gammaproteobacteria bacterium]|nr:phage tail tube protein [Gammaproteobacteria bacterium]